MSIYEWEEGSFTLPSREWVPFRKLVIQTHNARQDRLYSLAKEVREDMILGARGLRGVAALQSFKETLYRYKEVLSYDDYCGIHMKVPDSKKLKAIRRDPHFMKFKVSRGATLHAGDLRISLDDSTRTVTWSVEENNHARDCAEASWLGKCVLRMLDRVVWVSGTGGYTFGNDEYNREAEDVGGGGAYLVRTYGPVGKTKRAEVRSW